MPNRIVGLVLCMCASAAAAAGAQAVHTIDVTLPGTVDSARSRIVRVLVGQNLVVAEAQGPIVRAAPYRYDPATFITVTINLVGQDSVTRVVVSGTYSEPSIDIHDQPLLQTTSRVRGPLWNWLKRLALNVSSDSVASP